MNFLLRSSYLGLLRYVLIVLGLYLLIGFISGFSRSIPIINKVFTIVMLFFGFVILVIFPLKYLLPKFYLEFREAKSGLINAMTYPNIISGIVFIISGIFLLINVIHSIVYCLLSSIEVSGCFSETINNNLLIVYLSSLFLVIIFRILKKRIH